MSSQYVRHVRRRRRAHALKKILAVIVPFLGLYVIGWVAGYLGVTQAPFLIAIPILLAMSAGELVILGWASGVLIDP